jgi:hypothetical protein
VAARFAPDVTASDDPSREATDGRASSAAEGGETPNDGEPRENEEEEEAAESRLGKAIEYLLDLLSLV